jgi:hypothetical protein
MLRAYGSNVTGDVCAFDDATAAKLLENRSAVLVEKAPAAPKADKMVTPERVAGSGPVRKGGRRKG